MKTIKIRLVLLSLIGFTSLHAQSSDILASISKDMNYFDKVATITKENEHYQPYVISVFHGKELEKLGISNLKEALELVPSVDMATDNLNTQTPIFRGSNSLAFGQSKLFIDGVLVNNLALDAYSEYLSFPIEMIKRIEVIRGPGSKIDGVNAYAGSVNVITYAESFKDSKAENRLVFKYGSYDYRMGGFLKTYKTKDFRAFIDFYYQKDNKKLPAGIDGFSQGSMSISGLFDNRALAQSGDAPLWLNEYSLGVNLKYKDFKVKSRILRHKQGSAYGINLSLPQNSDRVKLPSYYLELAYNKQVFHYNIDIKAGVKYDDFDSKAKLAPDGLKFMDMPKFDATKVISPVTFTDGIYGRHLSKQRTLYQSSYLKYDGIDKHIVTLGYHLEEEKTIGMLSELSNWSTGDVELVDYTNSYPFFDKNAKRNVYSFLFQDEFDYSDGLSFLYGFNYEKTSYKDAGFEPRASVVYKFNRNNIFKAMYSRAHRNPSWQEMFTMNNHARIGNKYLEPEKVDAYELAYIRNFSSDSYLQTNLFYLSNKNQIYNSAINPQYKNVLHSNIYGLELEYKGHISSSDKIYLNYSYVNGDTHIRGESKSENLANVAHNMLKGYYIYNLNSGLSLSGVAKYIGSKERSPTDSRKKLKAYTTLDTALSYKNLRYGYSLVFSVKNIFDETVKYPSPPKTYIQDYEQERRTFLISISKRF